MVTETVESFASLRQAASRLGVSLALLQRELKAGRLPHLRDGRSVKVNVNEVRRLLIAQADANGATGDPVPR